MKFIMSDLEKFQFLIGDIIRTLRACKEYTLATSIYEYLNSNNILEIQDSKGQQWMNMWFSYLFTQQKSEILIKEHCEELLEIFKEPFNQEDF